MTAAEAMEILAAIVHLVQTAIGGGAAGTEAQARLLRLRDGELKTTIERRRAEEAAARKFGRTP